MDVAELGARHERTILAQHATITDALSGERLDVREQCVPIAVVGSGGDSMSAITEVEQLTKWLLAAHEQRLRGDASGRACILLAAEPAAGKMCLMSQVVVHALQARQGLLPTLLKVKQLQRHLLADENWAVFSGAWNTGLRLAS